MKYAFIKANQQEFSVKLMCEILEVRRSCFYAWCQKKPTPRCLENEILAEQIKLIFIQNKCRYGSRRIMRTLIKLGYIVIIILSSILLAVYVFIIRPHQKIRILSPC